MPTYEWRCKNCGSHFEKMIPMAEKKLARCPQCESAELQEIFGMNIARGKSSEQIPCAQSDSCPNSGAG